MGLGLHCENLDATQVIVGQQYWQNPSSLDEVTQQRGLLPSLFFLSQAHSPDEMQTLSSVKGGSEGEGAALCY